MATANLTKRTVDAAKAGDRDAFIWDDEVRGFGLKITPKGGKAFVFQYRTGGRGTKTQRYTIGTYGSPWTPDGARNEAKGLAERVRLGGDPVAEKRERQRVATDLAFDLYADTFLAEYVKREWKGSYGDAERIVRLHLKPVLKSKPLPSIGKADIAASYSAIPAHQVALRRKVHAILSRLFRWAIGRGDIERSPLEGTDPPPAPDSRKRWLQDWELRLVWLASDGLGYPFGPMYRLLLGTGARREEASALDWKELHRSAAEWRLPEARSKNDEPSVIHLSPLMIAELDALAGGDKWPRRGLVFTTTGKTPVSGYSRAKSRLDAAMLALARKEAEQAGEDPEQVEIEAWRVHDLRRTLATGMQRLGVRFEVTEAVLNHVSGARSGVAGVYQRHSWRDEKRDALNAWAAHIEQAVTGINETNVVRLASRA